jgi:hypothetical protein
MTDILDNMKIGGGPFVPETWRQYLALRVAKRLNIIDFLPDCVAQVEQHSLETVMRAFQAAAHLQAPLRARAFLSSLSSN